MLRILESAIRYAQTRDPGMHSTTINFEKQACPSDEAGFKKPRHAEKILAKKKMPPLK